MKIIHLVENLDDSYGGPAKSVPFLVKYLQKLGVENEMLSVRFDNEEFNQVINENSLVWKSFKHTISLKLRFSSLLTKYLNENIVGDEIILHTHNLWNYIPFVAYKKFRKRKNVRLVVAVRGSLYPWSLNQGTFQKKIAWYLFQKNILNNCSCIHVTDIGELEAVRSLGIKSPIAVVPNGVELSEFNNTKDNRVSRERLRLEVSKKYILFLSRVHPKKGIEFLIKGFLKIKDKYPEWQVLIAGPVYDKPYLKKIESLIERAKAANRFHFLGILNGEKRLDAFYSSNLFVLPSHTENFGIAIAEAMAAKLPVITTKGTPWKEILDYDAGWWVGLSQKNIDRCLDEALGEKNESLEKKGENAHQLILKYDWEFQAEKMKQVYHYLYGRGDKPKFMYTNNDKIGK
ncbi:glycosyltransferase [Echinicola sp. CAU 1574]|uniref:Glycosyltransferase n=1 Tax=Echinicola arenosa TaxID=2774144 RepID=A0ABR9ANZ4_9BACT|nr:glycosyltransferase [Echinicola arenosa]MBD8490082.1 glycosyltransferase [Echinicola arenosa]